MIIYPVGCVEVKDTMDVSFLISRLTVLSSYFKRQPYRYEDDSIDYHGLTPLCHYLVTEGFLKHPNKNVRILIASCVSHIIRMYAPDAPYNDAEQVKAIFKFLTDQLEGLTDPSDADFNRYTDLLQNLEDVTAFNMCFKLENSEEIFCRLFTLIFKTFKSEHPVEIKRTMFKLLRSLVSDLSSVPNELVKVILTNIVEPMKISNPCACILAQKLLVSCYDVLKQYLENFFKQRNWTQKEYDYVFELNYISPIFLPSIVPLVQDKLQSSDETERLRTVVLLSKLLSDLKSELAGQQTKLWQAFLSRFDDTSALIRIVCIQYTPEFFINHPELRQDVSKALIRKKHDVERTVRLEMMKAIVSTAKLDFNFISDCQSLIDHVLEGTTDSSDKIRCEALQGLALIYKTHQSASFESLVLEIAMTKIRDCILHAYSKIPLRERVLVERLFKTRLLTYSVNTDSRSRMLDLLYFYGTMDEEASQVFFQMLKYVMRIRFSVQELLTFIRSKPVQDEPTELIVSKLTKFLPMNCTEASEFVCNLSSHLKNDRQLLRTIEMILSPTTDCKTCFESMEIVLKNLNPPVLTEFDYSMITELMDRISYIMIDKEAIYNLVRIIDRIVDGKTAAVERLGFDKHSALGRGLKLLTMLSFVFTSHFWDAETVAVLTRWLGMSAITENLQCLQSVLECLKIIMTSVGRTGKYHPHLTETLVKQCHKILVASDGSPSLTIVKDAALAVLDSVISLFKNDHGFDLNNNNNSLNSNYRKTITALGHIALLSGMPEEFQRDVTAVISRKIAKELLLNPVRTEEDRLKNGENWCDEHDLPEITRCMLSGMKTLANWVLGLQCESKSVAKTVKLLMAFVETDADFINSQVSFSSAEKSWLRLTAGSCVLKICKQTQSMEQMPPKQFLELSKLMIDSVFEVRSRFAAELHLGLSSGVPSECLPVDFMGFYALAGYENNNAQKLALKLNFKKDVDRRREYVKSLKETSLNSAFDQLNLKLNLQLQNISTDHIILLSIPILASNPRFTSHEDPEQLIAIKECLSFILEPLLTGKEDNSFIASLLEQESTNTVLADCDPDKLKMTTVYNISKELLSFSSAIKQNYCHSKPNLPSCVKLHAVPTELVTECENGSIYDEKQSQSYRSSSEMEERVVPNLKTSVNENGDSAGPLFPLDDVTLTENRFGFKTSEGAVAIEFEAIPDRKAPSQAQHVQVLQNRSVSLLPSKTAKELTFQPRSLRDRKAKRQIVHYTRRQQKLIALQDKSQLKNLSICVDRMQIIDHNITLAVGKEEITDRAEREQELASAMTSDARINDSELGSSNGSSSSTRPPHTARGAFDRFLRSAPKSPYRMPNVN